MHDDDLRDLFAGMALQGMLAENGGGAVHNQDLAKTAYCLADAMIAEREIRRERKEDRSE